MLKKMSMRSRLWHKGL